jgi:hypothetical protein
MKKLILPILLMFPFIMNAEDKSEGGFNKTDQVLSEVVKKALGVAEKTGDFVIEQAPLLIQEFYAWHTWSHILGILFGVLLIILGRVVPIIWLFFR